MFISDLYYATFNFVMSRTLIYQMKGIPLEISPQHGEVFDIDSFYAILFQFISNFSSRKLETVRLRILFFSVLNGLPITMLLYLMLFIAMAQDQSYTILRFL